MFFLLEPVVYDVKYEVRRIPRVVLRALLEGAREHRAELFREWERNQADE